MIIDNGAKMLDLNGFKWCDLTNTVFELMNPSFGLTGFSIKDGNWVKGEGLKVGALIVLLFDGWIARLLVY